MTGSTRQTWFGRPVGLLALGFGGWGEWFLSVYRLIRGGFPSIRSAGCAQRGGVAEPIRAETWKTAISCRPPESPSLQGQCPGRSPSTDWLEPPGMARSWSGSSREPFGDRTCGLAATRAASFVGAAFVGRGVGRRLLRTGRSIPSPARHGPAPGAPARPLQGTAQCRPHGSKPGVFPGLGLSGSFLRSADESGNMLDAKNLEAFVRPGATGERPLAWRLR